MKQSSRFTGLVLAWLGAMVLLNNLGKPRVEALHGSDVWGLVASGMLLGIGFVGLIGRLKLGNESFEAYYATHSANTSNVSDRWRARRY